MKKSLFKSSASSAKPKSAAFGDRPIFQQNIYEDILAANKKKEERRLARRKEKEEQRRDSSSKDVRIRGDEHPVKKQRLSSPLDLDADDSDSSHINRASGSESDTSAKESSRRRQRSTLTPNHETEQARTSPRKVREATQQNSKPPVPADDDDDLIVIEPSPASRRTNTTQAPKRVSTPEESDSDPDDDEYVKELKRAARDEARRKRLAAAQKLGTPATDGQSLLTVAPSSSHSTGVAERSRATPSAPDLEDPVVHIRITTIIPGCDELFIQRRASQPLDIVLETFVKRHELRPELARKVFFTWNGTRLFKSTTMRSILAMIKNKHGTKQDGTDLAEGKIEIEAVTDEIFEHRKKQKERERKRLENGESYDDVSANAADQNATGVEAHAEQGPKAPGIVLQLRSNEETSLPSMHLRVRSDTTVIKIIRGYKRKNKIDMSRDIYLVFEGDRLEDEQTAEEIGFEDMDTIDIRSR